MFPMQANKVKSNCQPFIVKRGDTAWEPGILQIAQQAAQQTQPAAIWIKLTLKLTL